MRKAASSLIALRLLKFQIQSQEKEFPSNKKSPRLRSINKLENDKPKRLNKAWKKLKDFDIAQISAHYNIPVDIFLGNLEQLGIETNLKRKFSFDEFERVYKFIRKTLKEISQKRNREKKTAKKDRWEYPANYRKPGTGTIPEKKIKIKKHKKTSTSGGVFGKIHKAGGLGKIIYTRM